MEICSARSGNTACRMCSLWELNNFDYYMGFNIWQSTMNEGATATATATSTAIANVPTNINIMAKTNQLSMVEHYINTYSIYIHTVKNMFSRLISSEEHNK